MASSQISGVRLAGIAAAVPATVVDNSDFADRFGAEETQKICESTGIAQRRVAEGDVCTSDLCLAAAEQLLDRLGWERESIVGLVFVSQTPDHTLPATSCILHERLKLSTGCAAFDINQGCSGYVYGLWLASQMTVSLGGRVLLLVGDTINKLVSPDDRATALLFSDAGSATALEPDARATPWNFSLGSDGRGWQHLKAGGGFRQTAGTDGSSNVLFLNGAEVFAFTLREVPKLIKSVLEAAEWTLDEVDSVVMHQANEFMLRHLAKRLKIPDEKLVLTLKEFGNTSCTSIPLAVAHALEAKLTTAGEPMKLLLAGFGVGWSWGAVALTLQRPVILPVIEIDSARVNPPQAVAAVGSN